MNEKELREAVRAEFGGAQSSRLVDQRMREAYDMLEEQEMGLPPKKRRLSRVMKILGGTMGGLAAAFLVLVGLSTANPALAASIPGMESIIGFFQGSRQDSLVAQGGIDQYVQPVASETEAKAEPQEGLQITETYFDGQVLVAGVQITLPDAPKEYRELMGDYELKFTADGKELAPTYQLTKNNWETVFTRISEDTYVSTLTLYPADSDEASVDLGLPEEFTLSVGLESFHAIDPQMMVLAEGSDPEAYDYVPKTYELEPPEPFTLTVKKSEGLKKEYPVNETKNGCNLQQVTVTPAWTEIKFELDESLKNSDDPIMMVPYDSKGNELETTYGYGVYQRQRFRSPDKDETAVIVKFFYKNNAREPIAEFTVPVDGGYYQEKPISAWSEPEGEVVYDPPMPEDAFPDPYADASFETIKLNDAVTVYGGRASDTMLESGSADVTFSNLRTYSDWQDAGIAEEDMNLSNDQEEHPENYAFVLLDVTYQCHDAVSHVVEDSQNVFWINSFTIPRLVPDGTNRKKLSGMVAAEEISYFSEHGIGFSDYYHFSLEPNETKTIQMGFVLRKEDLEAGKLQLAIPSADLNSPISDTLFYNTHYYLLDIPAETGSVK